VRVERIIARIKAVSGGEVGCSSCEGQEEELKAEQNTKLLTLNQMRFGSLHHEFMQFDDNLTFLLQLSYKQR
jgi:hypothetical protein